MAETPTQVVGRRVREVRARRGWSASELADRCSDAGSPWVKRPMIADLETGRRQRVSVDEMLVLAHVLKVPPVLLVTPGSEPLEVTPGVEYTPMEAMKWFVGSESVSDDLLNQAFG